MHITMVTRHDLLPAVHGAAVKIVRTAEALARGGATVTAVTSDRLRYHLWEAGKHEEIAYPQRLVAATREPPRLSPFLRRVGVPDYWRAVDHLLHTLGYPADEHLLYQPVVDPDFWLRTLYVGWKHGTDWFQAEFPGFGVPAWVAARLLRRKCSVVQHNVEWQRLAETTKLPAETIARLRGIETQICHLADEVITCSADDRRRLQADDFEEADITVIPHGVDLDAFSERTGAGIRQKHGIAADRAVLFFHGTLHYWPNTVACRVLAEEILPRLRARGVHATALIAGMSPPEHHAHPDLVYAGCVEDLASYVAAADLAVVPLLDGGGTRLKILEYFAAGKGVISTKKGAEGLSSRHGVEVVLTEDGDWDGFSDQIARLLAHPGHRAALGDAARRFAEGYSWDAVGRAFLSLYRDRAAVRGTDWNEAFERSIVRVQGSLDERASHVLRERGEAEAAVHRKELVGNALIPQDAPIPQIRTWDETDIVHEVPVDAWTEHVNADVTATKPRTLILLLMKRCNLRCDFCDLWHHTDLMPYEHAATILLRAPAAGIKTVVLTGGEPFVHPRIWDIIELAKNLGLGVNITTNGTLLRRDLGRLGRARIDSLSVSLDGWEETHERLRGVPGCFRESVDAIEAIRAQTAIWVNVYFVVTNQNVSELRRVFDWTRDRGLGFDFWPVNGYPHLYITSPDDRRAYLDAIDHIAQHSTAVLERIDYYRYGLEYMAGRRDHLRCLGLVEQMGVNHQGKLVPCCVWDQKGLQVGSALDEPLDQLLHSRRAQRLRKAIVEEGCVDQCLNHSLYEFQAATGLPFVVKPAERELDVELAVLKQSGQARAGEAKARKRAEARARRVPA